MSRCGAAGGGGDLRGGARGSGRRFARVVGPAGGAGRPARGAGGAGRGARAAAETRFTELVAAAEPRPALAGKARPVARDRAQAGRPARSRRTWARSVPGRAGDGGSRALAAALQLRPRLRRGRARATWCAGAETGGGAAAAGDRDQRALPAASLLSRLR